MLLASVAVQCYSPHVQPAGLHARRHATVQMEWDYAKQYAEQQAAQRAARMRRLEAEEAAEEAKNGGFRGGVFNKADDSMPKQLTFDERVTSSWESSDANEFLPEEGSALADKYSELLKVKFTDGLRGSQHDGEDVAAKDAARNPEMTIDADPTLIYMPANEDCDAECQLELFGQQDFVLPDECELAAETCFDGEFQTFSIGKEAKTLTIDVPPVAMAFEDFYCGFTSESHPAFRVTQNSFGKMERRNGAPTRVEVTVDPRGLKGELVGHLCFIQPEEKSYSTFYKITCDAK